MVTISIRFDDMSKAIIPLGYVGENKHRRVLIDCKKMFEDYPTALPVLAVTPPKGETYPGTVTREGDTVMWDITDSDVLYAGNGMVQLSFTVDDIVAKSAICKTRISVSNSPTGSVPTGIEDWLIRAAQLLTDIPEEIDAAIEEAKASGMFDGVGISSIGYVGTVGKVNTYRVNLTDGTHYDFTVDDGDDGVGISSITKTGTSGLVDTYTITLTNNQTYTFTVTNGENGVQIDDVTPAQNKVFSSAKVDEELTGVKNALNGKQDSPETIGIPGQVLGLNENLEPEWIDASVDPDVVEQFVEEQLEEHPEWTTTVQDGAVSYEKLDNGLKGTITETQSDLKTIVDIKPNLVDESKSTSGYINKSGTVYASDTYKYTEKIPVAEGVTYYLTYENSSRRKQARFITAYNSNNAAVSNSGAEKVSSWTCPSGIVSIVISYFVDAGSIIVSSGKQIPYIPYGINRLNTEDLYMLNVVDKVYDGMQTDKLVVKSSNLIDDAKCAINKYMTLSGVIANSEEHTYSITDYIKVIPGKTYYLTYEETTQITARYITAFNGLGSAVSASGVENASSFTCPNDIYAIVVTYYNGSGRPMLAVDEAKDYEPFGVYIPVSAINGKELTEAVESIMPHSMEGIDELIIKSKNLLNTSDADFLEGYYIATNGTPVESAGKNVTGYILVKKGDSVIFSNNGEPEEARFVAVYNSSKQYTSNSGHLYSYTNSGYSDVYVRVSYMASFSKYQIQYGNTITEYADYGSYYLKNVPAIEKTLSENIRKKIDIYSTGDINDFYNSMKAACDTGNMDVYIHRGSYVFTDAFIETLITKAERAVPIGNNNRYFFETGAKITAKYTTGNPSSYWYVFAPVYDVYGSYELHNLNLEAAKVCYGVHDEYAGTRKSYRNVYDHCRIVVDNTGYTSGDSGVNKCIGGGLGGNAEIIIDGCYFDCVTSPTQDVSYHGATGTTKGDNANIIVKDSWFRNTLSLNGTLSSTSEEEKNVIFCNNCVGSPLRYASQDIEPLWNVTQWNNVVRSS